MNNLKRRALTLLLSLAMVITYMPMSMITAYAAVGDTPAHTKNIHNNGDGTYTISLDVVGDSQKKPNNVNVIVIFDRSGSMNNNRMTAAKNAVNSLANSLFAYNTQSAPNTVQMALVDFSTHANSHSPTNSASTFRSQVNGLSADGGTNWEAALKEANNVNFGDNDQTFVIFVSDGNPTFRDTQGTTRITDNRWYNYDNIFYNSDRVYGLGSDNPNNTNYSPQSMGYCYDHAVDDAQALVNKVGADNFFTIGAYGNVSRMQTLTTAAGAPSSNFYNANDTTALNRALSDILAKIEMQGIANASIDDGTTNQVTATSGEVHELLEVDESSYKYYRSGGSYGTQTEWADAPEAKFENGSVKWDLADEGILENGVKYTVTFDCYPSQETYDTIAKLKNGDITYNSLDSEIKKYIIDNGDGSYSLRTNTNATLSYDDTRDDAGQKTVGYTNPPDVATDAETMSISKTWEGEDPDVESLKMTVLMDGNKFHESTLSSSNDWSDSSFISIGIIKNGEALPGAEGRDFSFAELDGNQYHWELDAPTVHPMLIDGTKTMLIKVDDKHPAQGTTYTINGAEYYADSQAGGLKATNHRRSNLNLKKAVMGEDAPEDATFPFTITVNNSKAPKTEPTDDPEHNSDYWVWFSVDSDPSESFSPVTDIEVSGNGVVQSGNYWYAPSGTAITVNGLKADWNLRFTNLPSGSTYTITEGTMPDGFIFNKAELTAGEGEFSGGQTSTGTITNTKTSYEVTYTNEYARVDINVDKVWDDANDQAGFRPDELTLTLNGVPSGTTAPEPEITKSEDGNTWSYVWKNLPKYDAQGNEIQYTVTENQVPEHYECTGSPASDGGTITNKHTPEVTKVTVVKVWDDDNNIGNIRPESIQAQLKADGTASGNPVTLSANSDPAWSYTWDNLPKYKNGTEIVYTADETEVPTGYNKTGPVETEAEDGTTFTVTNTYNPTSVKKAFKATKTTSGYPAGGKNVTFTFTLTPATGAPGTAQNKELTLSGAKPSGEVNFDEIEFTKPGVFEYTVAETAGTADGWTYATNTYTVTVTVRDDGTGKLIIASVDGGDNISFNNEYEPEGTEVTLSGKKTLNGRAMEAGEFSFKLSTKSGEAVETVQNTDTDGNYAFSALTFDTAGTYEYVIEEVNNGRPNVTYDTKKYNVTITVTDDGSGKLSAAISGDVNAQGNNANFTNSYEAAPTSVTFSGIKNISGYPSAGKDVTFSFTLTPGTGAPGSAQTKTVTLNGNTTKGDILFDAINFDAVGEYTYTIAETSGGGDGWTNSSKVYNVTVNVTDNPETGSLKAAISGLNEDGSGADFQNTYQAGPASITIVGMKTMVNYGKTLEADKFSFTITGEGKGEEAAEEQTVEEQTTDEQSTDQAADEQPTDQADNEQPTDQADNEQPADQADNEQPADQANNEQPADQANNEQPADQADNEQPAEGNDTITGAVDRIKGYFTVYALDESTKKVVDIEAPLPDQTTVKNQKGGRVEFGTVEFTRAGTYTYTITESGSMPGVDNDPNPKKTFTVEVTDDGTGTLKAKASPEGEFLFEFKNTYVTPPTPSSVTDQIKITKKLVGHDLEEGFFKFQMLDKSGKVVSTGTNDKDGVVTFAPVTFTEAGNFEYTVQEVDKKSEVIKCDTTPYPVTAEVTNNYDGEKLKVEWKYAGGNGITITNTYSDVVAIDPPVQKIVEGSPDTTETYTFKLEAVTAGAPMPSAAGGASSMTMNITGTGAKEFGVINYTKPGEYTYKVTEVAGSNPNCQYDGSVYTVTAKVTEDPNTYKLSVKTTYTKNGAAVDTAVFKFVNTYPDEPDEPDDSDKPNTGDTNDLAGMLGLMGASAGGLLYIFFRRRREEQM